MAISRAILRLLASVQRHAPGHIRSKAVTVKVTDFNLCQRARDVRDGEKGDYWCCSGVRGRDAEIERVERERERERESDMPQSCW
jgi:hypothetical protein